MSGQAPIINPKAVNYTKASQISAHQNGVYKVFPKRQDASTGKFTTDTVVLNEENLKKGYVFFPGSRIAFFVPKDLSQGFWWNDVVAGVKPVIQVPIEVISNAHKVLQSLSFDGTNPTLYAALVHPNYAQQFSQALERAYNVADPNNPMYQFALNVKNSVLQFIKANNLQQAIDFFAGYDAKIANAAKSIENKTITLAEARKLISNISGITKSLTKVEGKAIIKASKTVSVNKINYSVDDLSRESKAGYWFNLSGAEIKEGGKFKGITKTTEYPTPDRHFFYKNPALPLNLYYSIKDTPAKQAEVLQRVLNFMRARNLPTADNMWERGSYQATFAAAPSVLPTQVNTGMGVVFSNRPVAPVAQQPLVPPTSFGPAPINQVPAAPSAFGANPSQAPSAFGANPPQAPSAFGGAASIPDAGDL